MGYSSLVQPGGWPTSTILNPVNFEELIRRIGSGVNGDTGGSYAPANPIEIHGAGVTIDTAPTFIEPYLRTIRIPSLENVWDYAQGTAGAKNPIYLQVIPTAGALGVDGIATSTGNALQACIPLSRLSDGCVLTQLTAEFYILPSTDPLPDETLFYPTLDIRRLDPSVGIAESIGALVTFPTPTDIDAYRNTGQQHELVFIPDSTKALVDLSTYVYFAVFTDIPPSDFASAFLTSISASAIVANLGYQ